jgi:hypothetical protein
MQTFKGHPTRGVENYFPSLAECEFFEVSAGRRALEEELNRPA